MTTKVLRSIIALCVLTLTTMLCYQGVKKGRHDAAIAADTRRIANALERQARR